MNRFWEALRRQQNLDKVRASESAWALAIESFQEDYNRTPVEGETFTAKNNRKRMLELCTLNQAKEN